MSLTSTIPTSRVVRPVPSGTSTRALPFLAIGAICGLAWAAGFRGWMAQLAWGDQGSSSVTWLTMLLVLLPGLAIGVLFGAAYDRRIGVRSSRWLVWSPVLFAAALLDPGIFLAFIRDGTGGGALMVVFTALGGGFVLSRRRWSVARVLVAIPLLLGLVMIALMGGMAGPLQSPRGAWVALYGLVYMVLLCLASALPYPPVRDRFGAGSLVTIGALGGLAWACGLRSLMAAIAGLDSSVTWVGTFAGILAPGLVVGALLGWAEHLRRNGGRRHWRCLAAAPLLLAAVVFTGGALGIALLCMAGGHAISGRGSLWARWGFGTVAVVGFASWIVTGQLVFGADLMVTGPLGLWVALYFCSFVALLMVGCAIPHRKVIHP